MNTALVEQVSAVEKLINSPVHEALKEVTNSPLSKITKQQKQVLKAAEGVTRFLPKSALTQIKEVSKLTNISKDSRNILDPTINAVVGK